MSDIITIKAGNSSVFKVISGSADPANPTIEDVIFDGNQQPLRVKQKGQIVVPNGPGMADGNGAYGGSSTPIMAPTPGKRHYVLGLGYSTRDSSRRTPGNGPAQTSNVLMCCSCSTFSYWQDQGIGVATDENNVWGFNFNAYTPIIGGLCTRTICVCFDKYGCCGFTTFGISGTVGFQGYSAHVNYCVLHNTIG